MFAIEMWTNMFGLEVSIVEKIVRSTVVYLFLLISLRLAGKRELAQLNAMDLIVLLMLSNTVQNAIIGRDDTVVGGLLGATTLLVLNYLVVRFLFSHERIDRLVEGEPTTLMENGKILDDQLRKEFLTPLELEIAAHKQGFSSLDLVEGAVLESSGAICFVGKEPPIGEAHHQELTGRLDALSRQIDDLKAALAGRRA